MMWRFFLLLSVACQSVLLAPVTDDLIISLPDGQVQGTTYTTDKNITFHGFQGIPYATPPLGSLRFEAPQPAQRWTGVWDATKDSNACLTTDNAINKATESEDCLFINVYTPSLQPAEKLSVLLWIYGGSFMWGNSSKDNYGPDYLIEEGVIVVSFNYRLGPFGFLSTGDSAIVGNAGLKDQALAIKWVHDNIEYFGGDSAKITIFGESAGAASAGLHLLNPQLNGLYRAAILESGSAISNWTIDLNPKAYANMITTQLGGETYLNDTQELKTFLQGISAQDLINVAILFYSAGFRPVPVIETENESAVLTESPYVLLDSGRFNQVPLIAGICANEAGYYFRNLESVQARAVIFDASPEVFVPINLRQNSSDTDVVIRTIKNLYLQEGDTFSNNLVALTNLFSDSTVTKAIIRQAELSSKSVPAYLYQFSHGGRPVFPFVIPGAEKAKHMGELAFLFKLPRSDTTDPIDILTQNRMVKLWANFAKFLNPTPEQTELIDVIWPTVAENELRFLNINATLEVGSSIRGASYEEWKNIYEIYGKKPFITY